MKYISKLILTYYIWKQLIVFLVLETKKKKLTNETWKQLIVFLVILTRKILTY